MSKNLPKILLFLSISSVLIIYLLMYHFSQNALPRNIELILNIPFAAFIISAVWIFLSWFKSVVTVNIEEVTKIASWSYTDEEWSKFLSMNDILDEKRKDKFSAYDMRMHIYNFMIIMIFIVYLNSYPELWKVIFLYAFLFEAVFYLSVYFYKKINIIPKKNSQVTIYFDEIYAGILIGTRDIVLTRRNGGIDNISYNETTDPNYIEIEYSYKYSRGGTVREYLRVPVPTYEKNAPGIIEKLINFKPSHLYG